MISTERPSETRVRRIQPDHSRGNAVQDPEAVLALAGATHIKLRQIRLKSRRRNLGECAIRIARALRPNCDTANVPVALCDRHIVMQPGLAIRPRRRSHQLQISSNPDHVLMVQLRPSTPYSR
jgi:hypothetical protein